MKGVGRLNTGLDIGAGAGGNTKNIVEVAMNIEKGENKANNKNEPADFEKAISATGFGKFNFLLLIIALPSCFATVYETSTMSYILPSAECDLQLTLIDKGVLNAITYAGMITSAIFWGYAADTKGRRKLLIFGYLLDSICVTLGSLSQNVYTLMTFKYLGGFLMCGPFAVLMSYVTELHGVKHRARVMMLMGMFFSIGTLLLPMLAWALLPRHWDFVIVTNYFVIRSWQVFLAICAMPSLISGIAIMFLPESPKFLMSQGRNDEALEAFRKIFALNMNQPRENYPITQLVNEVPEKKPISAKDIKNCEKGKNITKERLTIAESLRVGLNQLRPMFSKPYLGHSIHVYTIQFCILMGLNTMRLWLPQLFTSIAEFEQNQLLLNSNNNNNINSGGTNSVSNLCAIIAYSVSKSKINIDPVVGNCTVTHTDDTYVNTIIVGLTGLGGYFVAGALINALGNKNILITGLIIAGMCGLIMYWASSSLIILILSSIYTSIGSIGSQALLGVIVNLFPTQLRTMIVSLSMMFGRLGALIGNILFPFLMSMDCLPPFFMVGIVMLVSSGLCCLLPNNHKEALK